MTKRNLFIGENPPNGHRMISNTTPEISTVAERLVSEGTHFIAAEESGLAEGNVTLLYYLPSQDDDLITHLHDIDHVLVDGEAYPTMCTNVIHPEAHFAGRLPIFAVQTSLLGLPEYPLEKGLKRLSAWLDDERQPIPPVSETAPLYVPIQKLILAGATAIGLEKELYRWADGNLLSFKVHMPPAVGAAIVDQYDSVVIGGETYDIDWTFSIDGPGFSKKVPVYADNDILGMDAVPIKSGWGNLRAFLREDGSHVRVADE